MAEGSLGQASALADGSQLGSSLLFWLFHLFLVHFFRSRYQSAENILVFNQDSPNASSALFGVFLKFWRVFD